MDLGDIGEGGSKEVRVYSNLGAVRKQGQFCGWVLSNSYLQREQAGMGIKLC